MYEYYNTRETNQPGEQMIMSSSKENTTTALMVVIYIAMHVWLHLKLWLHHHVYSFPNLGIQLSKISVWWRTHQYNNP